MCGHDSAPAYGQRATGHSDRPPIPFHRELMFGLTVSINRGELT
jgi:hypothetical protein